MRQKLDVSFPILVVMSPPFEVAESGYGSFDLPVKVYFRRKDEPNKVGFAYFLLLPKLKDPPIDQIHSHHLTFHNPNKEFIHKLLKAGGVISGCTVPPPLPPTELEQASPSATIKPPQRSAPGVGLNDYTKKNRESENRKEDQKTERVNTRINYSTDANLSIDVENMMDETPMKKDEYILSPNTWEFIALQMLHKQLNALQDPQQLQEIVDIMEQTTLYSETATTFDFDLCKLDDTTLSKLEKFIKPI